MCGRVPQLWSPCRAPRFSPERAKLAVNQLEVLIFYGYFQGVVLQSVDLSLSSLESKLPSLPVTQESFTLCLELLDLWPLTFVYEARARHKGFAGLPLWTSWLPIAQSGGDSPGVAERTSAAFGPWSSWRWGFKGGSCGRCQSVGSLCTFSCPWSFSPDFGWIVRKSWTRTGKWSVCICQCRRMILLWRVLGDR